MMFGFIIMGLSHVPTNMSILSVSYFQFSADYIEIGMSEQLGECVVGLFSLVGNHEYKI